VFVLAVAAVLGGCTDDGESGEITSGEVTATSESTTSTTEATTTTSTTEDTTSTSLDDETAVRERHTYFMTEALARDEREITFEEQMAILERIAVDPLLKRSREIAAENYELGYYAVGPGYDSHIVDVDVADDRATVFDCSQGRGELYAADGELLIPADDFYKIRRTELVKIDGQWFVEDLITGGDTLCEPED